MENNTLTQMWETRPPRIPENQGGKAVIGGVCEGIGARFHICLLYTSDAADE